MGRKIHLVWDKNADLLRLLSDRSVEYTDNNIVTVDMSGDDCKHTGDRLIETVYSITKIDSIDNLRIFNYYKFETYNSDPIDITKLGLTSFSLEGSIHSNMTDTQCPVLLDRPCPTLRYFSLQHVPIDQAIVDNVTSSPELLGVMMSATHHTGIAGVTVTSIPAPVNRKIKYWMFNIRSISELEIKDWIATDLERVLLASVKLEVLPRLLLDPPPTLGQVYLPNNRLDNDSVMPLGKMLQSNDYKSISLNFNLPIIDIPVWDTVDIERVAYFAHDTLFKLPKYTCSKHYPEEYDQLIPLPIATAYSFKDDGFVVPSWSPTTWSESHSVFLYGVPLASQDYRQLFGYSNRIPVKFEGRPSYINKYRLSHI